jgi:predicted secreted protein
MATKFAAKGTKLQINTGSSLVDIPSVESFTFGQGQTELIDVTTLDSSSYREFVNGFKDADEISAEIIYDPADTVHEYIRTNHGGTAKAMGVVLSDTGNATFTFNALITQVSFPVDKDGPIRMSVTFKPTGAISFTA